MEPSTPDREVRRLSFPKRVRLLRTADFRKVYEKGRRKNLNFLLAFSLASDLPVSRIGFTVSRAVGVAVVRNRVKRRLREAARKHLTELGPGWDIVFNARASACEATAAAVEDAVVKLFRSLRSDSRR